MISTLITILIGLTVLSFLIFIHEAGHFLTARFFKVKVLEFGLGFPFLGKIFSFKKGETVYSVNWLFFGGFVQLYGEEPGNEKLGPESFSAQNVWKRIAIASAGVIVNILFAVIVFTFLMASSGFKLDIAAPFDVKFPFGKQTEFGLVTNVDENTPAEQSGLKFGDKILSVNENNITNFEQITEFAKQNKNEEIIIKVENVRENLTRELSFLSTVSDKITITYVEPDSPAEIGGLRLWDQILAIEDQTFVDNSSIINFVKSKSGQEITFRVQNLYDQQIRVIKVTPRKNPPANQGALGVRLDRITLIPGAYLDKGTNISYESFLDKIFVGFFHSTNLVILQAVGLREFVSQSFQQGSIEPIASKASGPVGVIAALGILVQNSWDQALNTLLTLTALISLMLGIGNLLPIPAVDGGRLAFFYIEALTGKKVSPRIENLIHAAGFAILLGLIVLISINDITKILSGRLFG